MSPALITSPPIAFTMSPASIVSSYTQIVSFMNSTISTERFSRPSVAAVMRSTSVRISSTSACALFSTSKILPMFKISAYSFSSVRCSLMLFELSAM